MFQIQKFLIFRKSKSLHHPKSYFRKQINENKQNLLKSRNEFQTCQAYSNYLLLICSNLSWSNLISRTRKIFQITLLQFEEFWSSKTEILEFQLNCLRGVLANQPSIWTNFTCQSFKIIEIPSIKRNNAFTCLFVAFPKLGGISKISKSFLKGNESFQLLRGGSSKWLRYRW